MSIHGYFKNGKARKHPKTDNSWNGIVEEPGFFNNGKVRKHAKTKFKNEIEIVGIDGITSNDKQFMRLNKYMINIAELRKNRILLIKYCTTRQISHKIPKQMVSIPIQKMLLDLIINDKFERSSYDALSNESDKELFKGFCDEAHIDVGINDCEDLDEKYNILIGEYKAGNDGSKDVLKRWIENQIASHQVKFKKGFQMLDELR